MALPHRSSTTTTLLCEEVVVAAAVVAFGGDGCLARERCALQECRLRLLLLVLLGRNGRAYVVGVVCVNGRWMGI